jgi:hypothetical protein
MQLQLIVRWTARVWSITSLLFVLAIALDGGGLRTTTEALGLLFFPIGVLIGFVIAWRRENPLA